MTHRPGRRVVLLAVALLTAATVAEVTGARQAAAAGTDPVVGDYTVTYGNAVVVTIAASTTGPGYTITSRQPVQVTGSSCYLPPGTLIGTLDPASGSTYTGTHGLWYTSDCSLGYYDSMTCQLAADALTCQLDGGYGTVVFTRPHAVQLHVLPEVLMAQRGVPIGVNGPAEVATFYDPAGSTDPADFSATVNWGDGQTTAQLDVAISRTNPVTDPAAPVTGCTDRGVDPPAGATCFRVTSNHAYPAGMASTFGYAVTITDLRPGGGAITGSGLVEYGGPHPGPTQHGPHAGFPTTAVGVISGAHRQPTATDPNHEEVFTCVAAVVDSPLGDMVITANHCNWNDLVDRIEFAPGYNGHDPNRGTGHHALCGGQWVSQCGLAPYGVWTTRDLTHAVFHGAQSNNSLYDVAFVLFPPRTGGTGNGTLEAAVGGAHVFFSYAPRPPADLGDWTIYGYGIGYKLTETDPNAIRGNLITCGPLSQAAINTDQLYLLYLSYPRGNGCPFSRGASGSPMVFSPAELPDSIGAVFFGGADPAPYFVGRLATRYAAQEFITAALTPAITR